MSNWMIGGRRKALEASDYCLRKDWGWTWVMSQQTLYFSFQNVWVKALNHFSKAFKSLIETIKKLDSSFELVSSSAKTRFKLYKSSSQTMQKHAQSSQKLAQNFTKTIKSSIKAFQNFSHLKILVTWLTITQNFTFCCTRVQGETNLIQLRKIMQKRWQRDSVKDLTIRTLWHVR